MPPFCPESLVWLLHLQRQPPCPCEGGTSSDSRWGWGRLTSGCCLLLSDKGCSTDSCWLVSLPVLLGEGVGVRWQWGVGRGGPSVLALLWAPRLTGLEESAWGDDDEATDHNYYNSIPGKEPPLGGLVDSRLAVTQPCALAALGGLGQVSLHPSMGQRGPGAILGVGECEEGLAYGRATMFLLQGMSPARRDARVLPWDVGPSGAGRLC